MTTLTTLCYIEKNGCYLMLHRNRKKNDVNEGKWIGLGGHFEAGESPEECLLREVKEESGLTLTSFCFRGVVTFVSGDITEYMALYTADAYEGELKPCSEGDLKWIEISDITHLNLWRGDRIFLGLLRQREGFFSLKLVYDGDELKEAVLDGEELPINDLQE